MGSVAGGGGGFTWAACARSGCQPGACSEPCPCQLPSAGVALLGDGQPQAASRQAGACLSRLWKPLLVAAPVILVTWYAHGSPGTRGRQVPEPCNSCLLAVGSGARAEFRVQV